ncbi:uncharacterized protein I303_105081 [Kwoniella dejecticola CBS 10117]|uniref:SMP-LTD domain-containing protein n=1 Tax=Kwoniella dejecticola CBS 10117 TaxID=1296121 RepID=A0A1A6A3H7_9TREE|nr:uncharacterized protein I303_05473 [Kwoniella dejecticola CBS 10117]OBR84614.1 hypothetical protein I303_05473 [Kwoniella dejecticola CBS 10117]
MWWPFQWLVIYVLGGVTFVPLVIASTIWYVFTYGSVPIGDSDPAKLEKAYLQDEDAKREQVEKSKASGIVTEKPLSGWLTVRRQFKPLESGSKNALATSSTSFSVEEEGLHEVEGEQDKEKADTESIMTTGSSTSASNPTTYSARIAQTYRSVMDARAAKKEPIPKEFFFCVLKGSVLFLYEDETQSNCVAALGVDQYTVRIEREDGKRFKGKDAEMFAKRNAIVMRVAKRVENKGMPILSKDSQAGEDGGRDIEMENKPICLFTKSNIKMEDWYLALLEASSQSSHVKTTDVFQSRDMQDLVNTIDTEPDPIPMRWLNAMFGRLFFSLYKTEALEQFIINRIMKKLTRVNRPSFLGPIVVREVNVGSSSPLLSKPMLKDLTAEGTAAFEAHIQYRSNPSRPNSQVRITIATTATIPTGFKPYVVDLVLAVELKSLEGNLVMQIKKPPSNRIWYGFTTMPKMEIEIIPVVSERKIQIGMVLKAIEKQIREVIAESVVLPNMDDLAFFDTSRLSVRGGIFNEASKVKQDVDSHADDDKEAVPETDIQTSNEDPSSAVPATANLRKRHPQKSKTTDVGDIGRSETPPGMSIPRTDTAPPTLSNSNTTKTAAAMQTTKKWFAQTGSSRTPSLSTQTTTGGLGTKSDENMLRQTSDGITTRPSPSAETALLNSNLTNSPSISAVQVSASTAPLSEEEKRSLEVAQPREPSPMGTPRGELDIHCLRGIPAPSDASIASTSSSSTGAIQPSSATQSSTASLISSLRSRDKQALQAQVGTARDSLKKWGVGLAAKRRAMKEEQVQKTESRAPALYRPPEEDLREDVRSHLATSPSKSLQDRLNAAAHADASSIPMPIPARNRSSSSSSRPSLFASPKSAASPASTSPPKWAPSTSGPTTSVVRSDTSTTPPAISHNRRSSNSTPVFTQPTSGRSMVVPRVPKRPGQVTGIGHDASEPMIRKVSAEDGLREERLEDVKKDAPPLPPRKSKESLRPESENISTGASPGEPTDIPSPAKSSTPAQETVPPPLPVRKPSPAVSGIVTPEQSQLGSISAGARPPNPVGRSNSMGAKPSVDTTASTEHIPDIDVTSPASTELQSALGKSPVSPSVAETALRSLVAKNEEALKAKARHSEPPSPDPYEIPIGQVREPDSGRINASEPDIENSDETPK